MRSIGSLLSGLTPQLADRAFQAGLSAYSSGDYRRALNNLQPLAEQGHSSAQAILGRMYFNGQGVPVELTTAAKWMRLAADAGIPDSQFDLACMYDEGKGVAQDIGEAITWYRLAAQWGLPNAQINLANCFHTGAGVPQDELMAAWWVKLAAEQGDVDAQRNLAYRYASGIGVLTDIAEAYFWFSVTADGVNTELDQDLSNFLQQLTPDQIASVQTTCGACVWKPKSSAESSLEIFKQAAAQIVEKIRAALGDEGFTNLKIIDRAIPDVGKLILTETHGLRFPTIAKNIKRSLTELETQIDAEVRSFEGSLGSSTYGDVMNLIRRIDAVVDVGSVLGDAAAQFNHNLLEFHLSLVDLFESKCGKEFTDKLLKRFALKQGTRAKRILPYSDLQKILLPLEPW